MNKILHINVGGYPFSIDDLAFEKLDHYLDSLRKHFERSEGCDEIMHDIESRIAEIFQEKMIGRSIVTLEMVQQAITIMGSPEAFGAEWTNEEEVPKFGHKTNAAWGIRTGKKLYRDPDDKKLAGVCSGLSHYFGIQDVVIMRVIFAAGLFAGGFTLILYLILWVATQEAQTAGERLAMRGEPINVQTIAKKVEEEIDRITDSFDSWRDKGQRKKKWRKS
ncbi:MAG: PspC domain-containing protein [Saprospiraceae bacterium]|nr:PspC domain-containing protein [Saprospiraceae bacterium]